MTARLRHRTRRIMSVLAVAAIFVGSALTVTASHAEESPPGDYVPAGYELSWSDNFDGAALSTADWYYREGEKVICANRPRNVSVSDGAMRIALKRESYNGMDYTCGGVISKHTFGYGYYETRAKLWGDQGFHSAFWQMGLADYVPDVPGYKGPYNRFNEIDGFEVDSHAPTQIQHHSHWTVPQHIGNQGGVYTGPDTSDGYHTFGYEWLPNEIRYYVDGVLARVQPYSGPHGMQNIWLTTLGYTSPANEANLPGETSWDYFRYYRPVDNRHDVSPASVLVDNGDPGYAETGSWTSTGEAFGFQDKQTRRANDATSTASWTPSLSGTQSYEVFVWNPSFLSTGHSAATYSVVHDGGSTDVVIDQRKAGQQWVSLGAYPMSSGAQVRVAGDPNGTGTLRADAVKFVPTIVVDNNTPGYSESGVWAGSTAIKGWRGTDTRYASRSLDTARWTPDLPANGTYDVYAWVPGDPNNAQAARFTVNHNGGTTEVNPDEKQTGVSRWVRLGNFAFSEGTSGWVELGKATGVTGLLRADAVKFVPVAPADTVAPSAPTRVRGTITAVPSTGDAVLDLQWVRPGQSDVVGHHVYLDGQRITANPVLRNTFRLHEMLAGQTYRFTVTAVDRWGNESATSTPIKLTVPRDTQAPAAPANLVGEAANGSAVLYWSQNPEVDLLGYNIYADGRLVNDKPVGSIGNPALVSQGTEIPNLANNTPHKLEVRTVDLSGNESASSTVMVTPVPMSIVGIGDPAYTESGTWSPSSVSGWLTSKTRATNVTSATAQWRPELATAGMYDVYAWVPNHANSTTGARYTITHADGTATTDIDQTTGGMKWILLGRYRFEAGTSGDVTISNGARAGYLRTNYVKFVPVS